MNDKTLFEVNSMSAIDLNQCQAMDRDDPLYDFAKEFHLPKDGGLYFCGHSLGPMPVSVRARVETELMKWQEEFVAGHFSKTDPWYSYHELLSKPMADIVGAKEKEVVVMNSLTTNLHLLFVSFFRPYRGGSQRSKILREGMSFPSDRFMLESQLQYHGTRS